MLKIFVVATLMAAMLVASALPAFAFHAPANDEHANCLGAAGSDSSTRDLGATGASRSDDGIDGIGRVDSYAHGFDPETGKPIEPGLCLFEEPGL